MAAGFVIALLLCSGDNCDLVRLDPGTVYATYEACRDASEKDKPRIAEVARQHREPGRDGDVICLRDVTPAETTAPALAPRAPTVAAPQPATSTAAATPRPAAQPAQTSSREFRDCEHCPVMVALPAGSFVMGSHADSSERPPHRVSVGRYALGKFDVTESEWAACVAASGCRYKWPSEAPEMPMRNLSWDDANEYVRWLRSVTGKPYRLPSEAEWEYAARAGTATPYPWGEEAGVGKADCKGCGNQSSGMRPVGIGAFPPNPWGLYDMLGGVAQWTADCWHLSYAGAPANASPWQAPRCETHVLRGGSWMNPPSDITVSSRNFYDSGVRYEANGMRVALSLK